MRNKSIKRKEDLKEILKKCSCCDEVKLASVTSKYSDFGAFYNGNGWHYQAWCKSCYREKSKYYSSYYSTTAKKGYIKERIRLKNKENRKNREWTVYRLVIDTTKFDDRVKKKYRLIHEKYYYVGITKQKVQDRWNKHLYSLKINEHSNHFLNCIYRNIRNLYEEMSDNEFFNFFKNDIIKFEVITKLDKSLSEEEAKVHEAFEVKRLEHSLRLKDKDRFIYTLNNKKKEKDLCFSTNEMICNVEHSIINTRVIKEINLSKKITQVLEALELP